MRFINGLKLFVVRGVFVLLALILASYVLLVLINWQDEAPSDDSLFMQQLVWQQRPIPDSLNGYQYWQRQTAQLPEVSAEFNQLFNGCHLTECLLQLTDPQTQLSGLLKQHQSLLAFYQRVMMMDDWQEPLPSWSASFPAFSQLLNAQRLTLAQAWLYMQQGDITAAQRLLAQDFRFWRKVLPANRVLLSKMISVSALKTHLAFAASLRTQLDSGQFTQISVPDWFVALTPQELNIQQMYAGEWHYAQSALTKDLFSRNTDESLSEKLLMTMLFKPFLQLQATNNDSATFFLACSEPSATQPDFAWYQWLYNPVGKALNSNLPDSCKAYRTELYELQPLPRNIVGSGS